MGRQSHSFKRLFFRGCSGELDLDIDESSQRLADFRRLNLKMSDGGPASFYVDARFMERTLASLLEHLGLDDASFPGYSLFVMDLRPGRRYHHAPTHACASGG